MVSTSTSHDGSLRSIHHLSTEQIRAFDDNGYLILRNRIPADMVERLRETTAALLREGTAAYRSGAPLSDFAVVRRRDDPFVIRVNNLHRWGRPETLELLGSPYVMAAAESLCGSDYVTIYDSLLVKQNDGQIIPWHQDRIHPRHVRIVTMGIYLDYSRAEGGALRVIPGTQTGKQDICRITREHDQYSSSIVDIEMNPGDMLLHDVMLVHASPGLDTHEMRRTIYFEISPIEQIIREHPSATAWIERRLRLLRLALHRYGKAYPENEGFQWRIGENLRPTVEAFTDERELEFIHQEEGVRSAPGNFCFEPDSALSME